MNQEIDLTTDPDDWENTPTQRTLMRYEMALRRIAECDDAANPLVKVALEALNP